MYNTVATSDLTAQGPELITELGAGYFFEGGVR